MNMGDLVKLDPAAIDELVGICNTIIEQLRESQRLTETLAEPKGFGDFDSARQLAAGFGRKAMGTPASAYERLQQFIDAYAELRDAFAGGGEAFLTEQFEIAQRIHNTGQTL